MPTLIFSILNKKDSNQKMEDKTKSTKTDDAQYQIQVGGLHEFELNDLSTTNYPVMVPSFAAILKWADNN